MKKKEAITSSILFQLEKLGENMRKPLRTVANRRVMSWTVTRRGKTVEATPKKQSWIVNRKDYGYPGLGSSSGVVIPVRKGTLTVFGYHVSKSQDARRKALKNAVKTDGHLAVYRKLNALIIFRKNTKNKDIIATRKTLESDRDWIKSQFMTKKTQFGG